MASLATVSTQTANQRAPTEPKSLRPAMQAGGFFFLLITSVCAMLMAFRVCRYHINRYHQFAGAAREPLKRARLRAEAHLIGTHSLVDAHL